MIPAESFWEASLDEIVKGYRWDKERNHCICMICGKVFDEGIIYPVGDLLLNAEKAVLSHIQREHQAMFYHLLNMDKKLTGLTDIQKDIMQYFYEGLSDKEIMAKQEGINSASTIRNYRFKLREREKQSKIFLALMMSLQGEPEFMPIHRTAKMVDDRYMITQDETEKVNKSYFKEGRLKAFPVKEKKKLIVIRQFANLFEPGIKYTEPEINGKIKEMYEDYATIRRYLISYGFLNRTDDGRQYWKEA
jgi:hypothetical protein